MYEEDFWIKRDKAATRQGKKLEKVLSLCELLSCHDGKKGKNEREQREPIKSFSRPLSLSLSLSLSAFARSLEEKIISPFELLA